MVTPEQMAGQIREWADSGYVNIVGGCCGSTLDHIRAIAAAVSGTHTRAAPSRAITGCTFQAWRRSTPEEKPNAEVLMRTRHTALIILMTALSSVTASVYSAGYDLIEETDPGEGETSTSSQVIFGDGFESGLDQWTVTGNCIPSASAEYTGSFGARCQGTATLLTNVSTVGFEGISLQYARRTVRYDRGELLYVEWSNNGSTWTRLEGVRSTVYALRTWSLPSEAENQSNLLLRFRGTADSTREFFDLDDVLLQGIPSCCPVEPEIDWAKEGEGPANQSESTRGASMDSAGNSVICGDLVGTRILFGLSYTSTSPWAGDWYVFKFNPSGGILWSSTFGGIGGDQAIDCDFDQDGNIIVSGKIRGTVNFGNGVSAAAALTSADAVIVKFDPFGMAQWARLAGGTGDDAANEVAIDSEGNIIVGIHYTSDPITFHEGTSFSNLGDRDVVTAKYDPNGTLQWAQRIAGSGADGARAVGVDRLDNVLIGVQSDSASVQVGNTPDVNLIGSGGNDLVVTRWTPSGELVWARIWGDGETSGAFSLDDETIRGIDGDGEGNTYFGGTFQGMLDLGGGWLLQSDTSGGTVPFTEPYDDIFFAKADPNGNVLWAYSGGSSEQDFGVEISVSASGELFAGGSFSGDATFNHAGGSLQRSAAGGAGDVDEFVSKWSTDGTLLWISQGGGMEPEMLYDIGLSPNGQTVTVGAGGRNAVFGDTSFSEDAGVYVVHRTADSLQGDGE